ncbi:MAG TPA: ABC transporter ATP-binding protein [Gammaproteobacteria bacterium]|nr:ABC transporter ATP-binding protein [Gammaproteobacteria bacterium]
MDEYILKINQLSIGIRHNSEILYAVDDLSFNLPRGKTFALVGESGCGKSITAHSIIRLLPEKAIIYQGSDIVLDDYPLLTYSEFHMREIRKKIGFIFQDPMATLNPVLTVRTQLEEALYDPPKNPIEKLIHILEAVRIVEPQRVLDAYPHELSGGMKQRVMIAMAVLKEPILLIADEPTTALDVTTQAQVLKILGELQRTNNMSILLITHDLGVVAQLADEVAVMYAGHIVEHANVKDFFHHPHHPYSQKLLAAIPENSDKRRRLSVIPGRVPQLTERDPLCRFRARCHNVLPICHEIPAINFAVNGYGEVRCHGYNKNLQPEERPKIELPEPPPLLEAYQTSKEPILQVENLKVYYPIKSSFLKRTIGFVKAVDGVSFALSAGQTLALVGESGCGKTTTGKAILKLIESTEGKVLYWGKDIRCMPERKLRKVRGDLQFIFQDAFAAMDPKMRIHQILEEGMIALKVGSDKKERQERIDNLLSQVGLSPQVKFRYPHEFSGGQRQRIAIARALAVSPKIIICDEPTSSLDVSVQAQILNLLDTLKKEYEISYIFITHNIGIVRYLADVVAVMHMGKIVEIGEADSILNQPQHPYTKTLLDSVPSIHNIENVLSQSLIRES